MVLEKRKILILTNNKKEVTDITIITNHSKFFAS